MRDTTNSSANTEPHSDVLSKWREALTLWECFEESETCTLFWQRILSEYTASSRHYHTIDHLRAMFSLLVQVEALVKKRRVVLLAIFFHDIIYDAKRSDNEELSAACFSDFATACQLEEEDAALVNAYILATRTHTLEGNEDTDLALFLDLDLSVLGGPWPEYRRYSEQIRQEYIHVPMDVYCTKRPQVLLKFLDRDRLFFSEHFYGALEAHARKNLQAEIDALGSMLETHAERVTFE